jgi:hypothetical protein
MSRAAHKAYTEGHYKALEKFTREIGASMIVPSARLSKSPSKSGVIYDAYYKDRTISIRVNDDLQTEILE